MKETPLHGRHLALKARLIDFSGWALPVQYSGILDEHHAVRRDAGLFDTSHMSRLRFGGTAAEGFLETLLTVPVAGMEIGRCRYGFMLNPQGGVIDDLILYRLEAAEWLLVANAGTHAKDLAWIQRQPRPAGLVIEDVSAGTAKLDIQGPRSALRLHEALGIDCEGLGRFRARQAEVDGHQILISRTGYTGECGYELYAPADRIGSIWDRLIAAGVQPAGLGARDTLRLEAGLPLYGHELDEDHTPVHAGLQRFAAKAVPYIGQAGVAAAQRDAAAPRLCGFRLSGRRSARHGDPVFLNDQPAGQVTSGSFAPSLGCAAGMAYLAPEAAQPGTAIRIGTATRRLDGVVAGLPLRNPLMELT